MSSLPTPHTSGTSPNEQSNSELYAGLLTERLSDDGSLEAAAAAAQNCDSADEDEDESTIGSDEAHVFISSSGSCATCGKDGTRKDACERCRTRVCRDCMVRYRKGGRVLYICDNCAKKLKKKRLLKIAAAVSVVAVTAVICLIVFIASY